MKYSKKASRPRKVSRSRSRRGGDFVDPEKGERDIEMGFYKPVVNKYYPHPPTPPPSPPKTTPPPSPPKTTPPLSPPKATPTPSYLQNQSFNIYDAAEKGEAGPNLVGGRRRRSHKKSHKKGKKSHKKGKKSHKRTTRKGLFYQLFKV